MESELVLLDFGPSIFCMRLRITLGEKGIEYELKEENLATRKSKLLLQMNPVHRKIPVLIHKGRPICESAIAIQYIEEVWSNNTPLYLSSDPYDRAIARFWTNYIDTTIYPAIRKIYVSNEQNPPDKGIKELLKAFKILERELGDKTYFGGDTFGFVDVSLIPFYSWFYAVETFGKFSIETECPKLTAWAKRCMGREVVDKVLPDPKEIYVFLIGLRQRLGVDHLSKL